MCNLNNAIKLYQEQKSFIIIREGDNCKLPIKNTKYNSFEEAEIDRIYYQPDYDEFLKVIEI